MGVGSVAVAGTVIDPISQYLRLRDARRGPLAHRF